MKIYTKKGDAGETELIGGKRVSKSSLRIDSYGTVDELNAFVGLIRDHVKNLHEKDSLGEIQNTLFVIGSCLAEDPEKKFEKLPKIGDSDVIFLEREIDHIEAEVPLLKEFILPGGHPLVSYCHIARSVCRRAERLCVELALSEQVPIIIITYLNRLSDYLFMLARHCAHDLGVEEIKWNKL